MSVEGIVLSAWYENKSIWTYLLAVITTNVLICIIIPENVLLSGAH